MNKFSENQLWRDRLGNEVVIAYIDNRQGLTWPIIAVELTAKRVFRYTLEGHYDHDDEESPYDLIQKVR